ncbi:hypothetical protein PSRE111525_27760 [Pseudomonas reidholzensis]
MTNNEIHQHLKYYKSLRMAACATGNRSESQRCSDILELLSSHVTGGARYER